MIISVTASFEERKKKERVNQTEFNCKSPMITFVWISVGIQHSDLTKGIEEM